MNRLFLILALLFAALPARAQVIVKCRTSGGALVDCSTPLNNGYVNWAAPGSLGSGTPNTVRGTTITATTQFTGSGAGLTNVPAASVTGSLSGVVIDCASNTCQNIANAALVNSSLTVTAGTGLTGGGGVSLGGSVALAVAYGTTAGTAAQGNDSRLPPAPSGAGGTLYDTGSAWARLAAGTANYLYQANGAASPSWVNSLSGVTINCSSNTCSNVSLTAAVTGVLPIANGGTNSNVALNNSRAIVSSGGAIIETASACGTGTVLNGGTPPNCTATPIIGTTLTVPRINSSGLILDATTGNNVQISINSTTVQTVTATGVTLAQPLAMSNQTISGLPAATASPGGQALAWPWITSTASFNTLSSGFTITAANGTYAGTGLTYTFSGAGTYWCVGTVRSSVAVSAGAGANISLKLRNTTTSTDLTNSIRIGAYASTVGAAYITTTPMAEVVTVTGADTIEVYAASNTGTTYTARSVDSDTAGYSKLGCMKIAP